MSLESPKTNNTNSADVTDVGTSISEDAVVIKSPQDKIEDVVGVEAQSVERWMKLGRENLEAISMPESLKVLVRESLDTPQLGAYHNEGPEMSAHLGLIMETVDHINSGKFDFASLGLPKNLEDKVRERTERAISLNYEKMKTYAYLHDLAKPVCMNIENTDGVQRVFTLGEWNELVVQNGGDKEKALAALKEQGNKKIGYRIGGELAKSLGIEDKDHGDEAERMLLKMSENDEEIKNFTSDLDLILKGVANHELHFQVFNKVSSGGGYAKYLASRFSDDEIDFIYTACLIDIAGSLNKDGKSDFQGFRNMVVARESHDLMVGSGLPNTESLTNLDTNEKVINGIKELQKLELLKKLVLDESDVDQILSNASKWGITKEEDVAELKKVLVESVGKENPTSVIGQALPKQLKRYIKDIKGYFESKLSN